MALNNEWRLRLLILGRARTIPTLLGPPRSVGTAVEQESRPGGSGSRAAVFGERLVALVITVN